MAVLERLHQVRQRIIDAARRGKRNPDKITLIAVTKNANLRQIQELIQAGHRDFGESRVQHLLLRAQEIDKWLDENQGGRLPTKAEIRWHMIGHLQRNKAVHVLSIVNLIHSVDSLRLAEQLNELMARREHPARILMEVNTTGEGSKFGIPLPAAVHLAEQIETMAHLQFTGLMTMAQLSDNPEEIRESFIRLRELFEEIQQRRIVGPHFEHLSMGMSNDFEIAIEQGSTMVRVGTAIFGEAEANLSEEPCGHSQESDAH